MEGGFDMKGHSLTLFMDVNEVIYSFLYFFIDGDSEEKKKKKEMSCQPWQQVNIAIFYQRRDSRENNILAIICIICHWADPTNTSHELKTHAGNLLHLCIACTYYNIDR